MLIDLENELLRLLNETRGSLLEDAELFNTLQTSKATSIAVQKSLEISEKTEIAIDGAREVNCPDVFNSFSSLFFSIGLSIVCNEGINFVLCTKRYGQDRSNVSVCFGCLHIFVHPIHRKKSEIHCSR